MSAPAGWYNDGNGCRRWWNGRAWTEEVWGSRQRQADVVPVGQMQDQTAVMSAQTPVKPSVFDRLGSSVMKAVADRKAEKEERQRRRAELERAAGALVTSGTFGMSKVEIFQGGYVRVVGPSDSSSPTYAMKAAPYEKLLSITFVPPGPETAGAGVAGTVMQGTAVQAVTAIAKGGAGIMKASAPGLAITGVAHVAKSMAGKSTLTITTDREIHTLTNQVGTLRIVKKEHEGVGRELERAGNSVLGVIEAGASVESVPALPSGATGSTGSSGPSAGSAPTISDRLRELAGLHAEGILDDAEFAAAKAKLLESL